MTKAETASDRVERRREEIIRAAFKVFTERGYHAAGIADIAAELGVGHGTFYRYFQNKRDILVHTMGAAAKLVMTALSDAEPTATDTLQEYRAQVNRICESLFTLFGDRPELVRLLFVEAPAADRDMARAAKQTYLTMASVTEEYLVNGVRKGFLRADLDTRTSAQALIGIIMSAGQALLFSDDVAAERDRWISAGTRLMFDGIIDHQASG